MLNETKTVVRWLARSLTAAVMVAGGAAFAEDQAAGDVYPLDSCPVSGQKLGSMGDPVIINHEGREIRLCCKGCTEKFAKDAANYLAKIDAEIVKQQMPLYPLTKCVVMPDDDVGDTNYVYKNRLVRFCCKNCIKDFNADPAKYLAELDKAVIEKQKATYPLDSCPVAGTKLEEGKGVMIVTGNRMVRFCCNDCIAKFKKAPLKVLSKLDEAAKTKGGTAAKTEEKKD